MSTRGRARLLQTVVTVLLTVGVTGVTVSSTVGEGVANAPTGEPAACVVFRVAP